MADNWFEISNDGWRRLNAGRPLGMLLREALQNAFDESVGSVSVDLASERILIEDDGTRGFADDRLIYTVFLTDKEDSPTQRGRKGRGLKELISAASRAEVETVGKTIRFDRDGRHVQENQRRRGTRLLLERRSTAREIEAALGTLRQTIPPSATRLTVNGRRVEPPEEILTLAHCSLETVVVRRGVECLVERETEVTLFGRRSPREKPQIFEMGLPVQPLRAPWHVDVAQRVPMSDGRDKIDETYRLTLLTVIFEALVEEELDERSLRDDWIMEVLSYGAVSDQALRIFVDRAYSRRAVLGASRRADDRARQVGAKVIETRSMARGVWAALARVTETSEQYVNRQLAAQEARVESLDGVQRRAVEVVTHLAREITGRHIDVTVIDKPRELDGYVEDASLDRRMLELKLNVQGGFNFRDPLAPASLAILFHELAHLEAAEHDYRFARALERVAGIGARLLLDRGAAIREMVRAEPPRGSR
jgi:hypothetical protein